MWYTFPSPDDFTSRFYVGGGGGYSLLASPTGGLAYGAVAGVTDAGYDAINGVALDDVVLTGNGSVNYDNVYMFAYKALGEMTTVGKAITPSFYGLDADTKIYTCECPNFAANFVLLGKSRGPFTPGNVSRMYNS